jgi:hypothetical protein
MFRLITFVIDIYVAIERFLANLIFVPVLRAIQRRRWVHEAQYGHWDLAMEMLRELNAELDAEQRRSYR